MALIPNPNFPVITHATWSTTTLPDNATAIQTQIVALITENKTDGIVDIPDPTPPSDAYRNWIDTDAANAWIAFVKGLNDPGLSDIVIAP